MKLAVIFLVPISAWLPSCNRNVVITHNPMKFEGNHKLSIKHRFGTFTISTFASWIFGGSHHRIHFGTQNSYELKDEQIWTLKCNPDKNTEGYFYIVNVKYPEARLAKWGPLAEDTGYYVGSKIDNNQLWNITLSDNGIRGQICNYEYSGHCLVKWGLDDWKVGARDWGLIDSEWDITPIYSNPTMKWNRIHEIDNTRGQKPIESTVTYEVGVSTSTTVSKSVEFGAELSLALAPLGITPSVHAAIETSTTNGRTETHTHTTHYTIEAGENWWLCQQTVILDSWSGRKDVKIISKNFEVNSDLC